MPKTKVLILNGPPSSGKDSLAERMALGFGAKHRSFKSRLFTLTRYFYGVSQAQWDKWYTTEGKGVPRAELDFQSCREALIFVSEVVTKPNFGNAYFGNAALKTMPDDGSVYVFSDGGFPSEIRPFLDVDFEVVVVRLHREGHTFAKDSRRYLTTAQFAGERSIIFTDEHFANYENPADYDAKLDRVAARLMELVQ